MRYLIFLCLFILTACTTTPNCEPVIVTQTVEVPIEVKCQVSYPTAPVSTLLALPKTASHYDKLVAALKDLEDVRWYSREVEAALRRCAVSQNTIDAGARLR